MQELSQEAASLRNTLLALIIKKGCDKSNFLPRTPGDVKYDVNIQTYPNKDGIMCHCKVYSSIHISTI